MSVLPELQPGERLDEVGIRGWRILQRADEFRFSIDAVLLAHFATVRKAAKAADLGAGTGAVGMFLLSRGAASVSGLLLTTEATITDAPEEGKAAGGMPAGGMGGMGGMDF